MSYFEKMRATTGLSRIGEPWSEQEEMKILSAISNGKNTDEISIELQRTSGSITSRIRQMACQLHNKGVNHTDITRLTRLSESEINEAIEGNTRREKVNRKPPIIATTENITKTDFMEMKCLLYEIRDLLKGIALK